MWVYTTNNEMINVSQAERIELRQETSVGGDIAEPSPDGKMTGISIIAHFASGSGTNAVQLAFVPAADNYDRMVTRYWNAIRTAIKSRAEICDLMDLA